MILNEFLNWIGEDYDEPWFTWVMTWFICTITGLFTFGVYSLSKLNSTPTTLKTTLIFLGILYLVIHIISAIMFETDNCSSHPKKSIYFLGFLYITLMGFIGMGFLFNYYSVIIWLDILIIIILAEILFLKDDSCLPVGESKFWFTAKMKGIIILETAFFFISLKGLFMIIGMLIIQTKEYYKLILHWMGIIAFWCIVLFIVIAILYGYVQLNSMKYNEKKKKTKRK